jgi:hypothetical protein
MKHNGYQIIHNLLEARFNLPSAKKARMKVVQLSAEYKQEQDPKKRTELLYRLKKAKSDLALMPNRAYGMYRDY